MSTSASRIRIKMCGITRPADLRDAVDAGADAVGFVLYDQSPRAVSISHAGGLADLLPPFVTPVLLFVNPSPELVSQAIARIPHALLQFHGDETAHFCESFAHPYVKAVRVAHNASAAELASALEARQHPSARALLLDSLSPQFGGSGTTFEWSILPMSIDRHVILSGGLHPGNVQRAIQTVAPRCLSLAVDVSSGIEASKGIKDREKMQAFALAVNTTPA